MERHYGDFNVFPKELQSLIFRKIDSLHLGRLLQLNKTFLKALDELGIWKYKCMVQWQLSPEQKINWKREYRILEDYSKRICYNRLIVRAADYEFVKSSDEDPNMLRYHRNTNPLAILGTRACQGKFKLYPLPYGNFGVAYYEVHLEKFRPSDHAISIGIALEKFVRAAPGQRKDSYGLHSDGSFYNQQSLPINSLVKDSWHAGDTLGLGVNYATKEIFITRNGALLGTMATRVRNLMHMHPTLTVWGFDNKCRVNFGQRLFEFDIVQYIQELDKDEAIKTKWPFKLYSEIICDFETQMLDSDDPKLVDEEIMHAEDGDEATNAEKNGRIDWAFFAGIELSSEEVVKMALAESAVLKNVLSKWITAFELEIDPNWTLSEVQKHVAGQVLFEATTHFAAVYLPEKIRIRKAKARENPNLKRERANHELETIYEENAILMLLDHDIPDDHMLIPPLIMQLAMAIGATPSGATNPTGYKSITFQNRRQVALNVAFEQYNVELRLKKQKEKERRYADLQKKYNSPKSFANIYGTSPFVNEKNVAEAEKGGEVVIEVESNGVNYSNIDVNIAHRFSTVYWSSPQLNDRYIPLDDNDLLTTLIWWHLALEETYDFKMTLGEYREHCCKCAQEEVDYWEGDQNRLETILRGTYGAVESLLPKKKGMQMWIARLWCALQPVISLPSRHFDHSVPAVKSLLANCLKDMPGTFAKLKAFKLSLLPSRSWSAILDSAVGVTAFKRESKTE